MGQKIIYNQVTEYQTLPQCLMDVEQRHRGKSVITTYDLKGQAHSVKFEEFVADVRALAGSLLTKKLAKKHVAIVGENSYEWVVVFCAVGCIGGVAIAVDIDQAGDEILAMTEFADACCVFVDAAFLDVFKESQMQYVIMRGEGAENSYHHLLKEGEKLKKKNQWKDFSFCPQVEKDDPLAIVYTSGTTSVSKPVVLSQYNMMFNACHTQSLVKVGERLFNPLPLYHTYSLVCGVLDGISQGADICMNTGLKTLMRDLRLYEPDTLVAVPMIMENLLKEVHRRQEIVGTREQAMQAVEKYTRRKKMHLPCSPYQEQALEQLVGPNLKFIPCGGAQLSVKVAEELQAYGVGVYQGYGITECSPLIGSNMNKKNNPASVGFPIPQTQIRLDDGEILVKGPSVFKEYYKNSLLTEESFTDEWFHTGDIGYKDRKGYLHICGRKKNLIVFSNGKKVVPEELEGYIQEIPLVKEVMVYGASAGNAIDDVTLSALICIDEERADTNDTFQLLEQVQEEITKLNNRLPDYKRIQSVKLTESEFKKTSIQKKKRREVTG